MIDTKPTTDARAAAGSQIPVEAKVVSTSSEAGAPLPTVWGLTPNCSATTSL